MTRLTDNQESTENIASVGRGADIAVQSVSCVHPFITVPVSKGFPDPASCDTPLTLSPLKDRAGQVCVETLRRSAGTRDPSFHEWADDDCAVIVEQ
ncbi:unnamed protein product [Merluccius merluccius]